MLRKYLPRPVMTLVITGFWMLLLNDFSMGGLVFGLILGFTIPYFTSSLWPAARGIRSYPKAAAYFLLVLWDIVVANMQVAYLILFRRAADLSPRFFTVPLDLRTPEAITVLASTITMTPGTVSSDLSADGRSLLVHGLDVRDEAEVVAQIKQRYEARLKEIFE